MRIDRRDLPLLAPGEIDVPWRMQGFAEQIDHATEWSDHSHPTHELLWNESGASRVWAVGRMWVVTPTIGLWVPAGVVHAARAPAGTRYRATHVRHDAIAVPADVPTAVEIDPLLRLLLFRIDDTTLTDASRTLTEQMVADVLVASRFYDGVRMPVSALLGPIADVYQREPATQRLLGEWAAASGVSERTLMRAFLHETGLGFSQWVAAVRAQQAITLLEEGMEIAVVADRVGYASVSAFGAAFRRVTGMTPARRRTDVVSL